LGGIRPGGIAGSGRTDYRRVPTSRYGNMRWDGSTRRRQRCAE
jgi:hypothetical protein